MNVLLLGCTSGIGQSITKIFSPNNNLILVGRSNKTLNEIKKSAISKGASDIKIIK